MRVIAQITEGCEELREELERFPMKYRAERIRLLASIGLFVLQGRTVTTSAGVTVAPSPEREPNPESPKSQPVDPRRNRLKGKFRESLKSG